MSALSCLRCSAPSGAGTYCEPCDEWRLKSVALRCSLKTDAERRERLAWYRSAYAARPAPRPVCGSCGETRRVA